MHDVRGGEGAEQPKTFGQWLHRMRKTHGLTQDELAVRAGCSKSYISALERDLSFSKYERAPRPSEATVDKFADVFGVDSGFPRILLRYTPAGSGQIGGPVLFAEGDSAQVIMPGAGAPKPAETAERLRAEARAYQDIANQLCAAADYIEGRAAAP